MKKKLFSLIGILILTSWCIVVADTLEPLLTDPQNDVVKYKAAEGATSGTTGAFHPEIDIKAVYLNGTDFIIEFCAPFNVSSEHWILVGFSNDSDDAHEFSIFYNAGEAHLYVLPTPPYIYWDASLSQWTDITTVLPCSKVNNLMIFKTVITAIPNIETSAFDIHTFFWGEDVGENWTCMDEASYDNSPIPGFGGIYLFCDFLMLIGVIFFLRRFHTIKMKLE